MYVCVYANVCMRACTLVRAVLSLRMVLRRCAKSITQLSNVQVDAHNFLS
jgi:hypothetical protein